MQKALKAKGIDNMLKEAREDNRENDAEHMRPVSCLVHGDFVDASKLIEGGRNDNSVPCTTFERCHFLRLLHPCIFVSIYPDFFYELALSRLTLGLQVHSISVHYRGYGDPYPHQHLHHQQFCTLFSCIIRSMSPHMPARPFSPASVMF